MTGPVKPGRLVCVVGPSGAGKDTLIDAACAARPEIVRARRIITRPADAGGENHDAVDTAEFAARARSGQLLFMWQAHGLSYGISRDVLDHLRTGRTVLFNGSRMALPDMCRTCPDLRVLLVTADPETLAQRLLNRGRETETEIRNRLKRSTYRLPDGIAHDVIRNDGPPEIARDRILAALADRGLSQKQNNPAVGIADPGTGCE